jgi:hypothetical protein
VKGLGGNPGCGMTIGIARVQYASAPAASMRVARDRDLRWLFGELGSVIA